MNRLVSPTGQEILFLGPPSHPTPLPALFFFFTSAQEALEEPPFHRCALQLAQGDPPVRVFSMTVPGHEEGRNKLHAMQYWADCIHAGEPILEDFFQKTTLSIQWLMDQQIVNPSKLGVGGISRGGFIAAHLAARCASLRTLLGFAPLTALDALEEFREHAPETLAPWNLLSLVEKLTHLQSLRFYIGNRDTRVGTETCFRWMQAFVEVLHTQRIRTCSAELFITQSLGHKGHGTSPQIFDEGTEWIKQRLY